MSALDDRKKKAAPAALVKTEPQVSADVVQLALRTRFNPLRGLKPQTLSQQLDNFALGYVAFAALTWDAIERRDDTLRNVASKRKKAVARLSRESLTREESPEAAAHKEALDEFYDNLSVVNALDENERGGFPLLVRQMMDAVGKYYAVHEIVWQPGGEHGDGDRLTAELRFTPLWFFENRTGKLQFLRIPLGGALGEPLDDGGWMVTKGDGLMEACSIAYMFKNLPLRDWVAYSDKFGTPGVLGQTNAAQGSAAGDAMKAAVASFGQNWSGVVYGADGAIKDPISLVTAGTAGEIPFPALIERMDRAMSALWRGSDLSTMSADTKGASVQDGESDILLEDDAALISDTLNRYLDRWVIFQKFGTWEALAYSKLITPERKNVANDVLIDTFLRDSGAQLGANERLEFYGRPKMDPKDTPLKATAAAPQDSGTGRPGDAEKLANESPVTSHQSRPAGADSPQLGKLLAVARHTFPTALAQDLKPLRNALAEVLQGDDATLPARAAALSAKLREPQFIESIIGANGSDLALFKILSAATAQGLAQESPTHSQP